MDIRQLKRENLQSETKSHGLNQNSVNVVLAADDGYAMPLAVTIHSIVENLGKDFTLKAFVIDGGITQENKHRIIKNLNPKRVVIEWVQPDAGFIDSDYFPKDYHLPIVTYFRLLIPQLLPSSLEKVIYLDCDLVVLEDLSKLWQININDKFFLAVQDMWIHYVSSSNGLMNYQELNLDREQKYFNSGVMFINVNKCKEASFFEIAIKYLVDNREKLRWGDQDVLNASCEGNWGEIDPRWNQQSHIFSYKNYTDSPFSKEVYQNLISNPYIVHYTHLKPWKEKNYHPYKYSFFKYLSKTSWQWFGYQLLLNDFWNRLIEKIKNTLRIG